MHFEAIIEAIGKGVDVAGIAVIILGSLIATGAFLRRWLPEDTLSEAYPFYRQGLGRAILLGLEFLVAADIIRTVAIAPTIDNVLVLAMIILIRTFLSITLELEIEGRWPWQRPDKSATNSTLSRDT